MTRDHTGRPTARAGDGRGATATAAGATTRCVACDRPTDPRRDACPECGAALAPPDETTERQIDPADLPVVFAVESHPPPAAVRDAFLRVQFGEWVPPEEVANPPTDADAGGGSVTAWYAAVAPGTSAGADGPTDPDVGGDAPPAPSIRGPFDSRAEAVAATGVEGRHDLEVAGYTLVRLNAPDGVFAGSVSVDTPAVDGPVVAVVERQPDGEWTASVDRTRVADAAAGDRDPDDIVGAVEAFAARQAPLLAGEVGATDATE